MRAIMVCVDYSDLLAVTLPYNRHHFDEVRVVTTHADTATQNVCEKNNALCHLTDAFYRDGAVFNKWLALEEGLDVMGRHGWLCLMDADVLWPKLLPGNVGGICRDSMFVPGQLYSPLRHMMTDLSSLSEGIPPEETWARYPIHKNIFEWAGYTQVFHADDDALVNCGNCGCPREHHRDYHNEPSYCHGNCEGTCDKYAWHETNWRHAGGADSFFQRKWHLTKKIRPPFNVLHLGPAGTNWCGRVTPYLDGTTPDKANDRRHYLKGFMRGRVANRSLLHCDRFKHEKLN